MHRTTQHRPDASQSDSFAPGLPSSDLEDSIPAATGDQHRVAQSIGHSEAAPDSVDAVSHYRLPPFWRTKPDLWFLQVEAIFHHHRIRADESKHNAVITVLDTETLQDVEDVLRSPSNADKYARLKEAILTRLTDSVDRQLLKLFTQLELGDKKPSQLLRHMRSLARNRVPDDVLRVKWMDLLPASVQRLLKVTKASDLEELAAVADEIAEPYPTVASTSRARSPPVTATPAEVCATARQSSAGPRAVREDRSSTELASIHSTLAQLASLNRETLDELKLLRNDWGRSRNSSRPRARPPVTQRAGEVCHYHRRWGEQAQRCVQPCAFKSAPNPGN